MRRVYTEVADFRAPFDSPTPSFSGLGDHVALDRRQWPARRSYQDVAEFRAPYDRGYYQDNSLFGLGAAPSAFSYDLLPPEFRRYVQTGAPMPTIMRDVGSAESQVPRLVWGVIGALFLIGSYRSYKRWEAERKGQG